MAKRYHLRCCARADRSRPRSSCRRNDLSRSDEEPCAPRRVFLCSGTEANMQSTFRKFLLIPTGVLCLLAGSAAAQDLSGPKEPPLQSAPVSLQPKALKAPSVTVLGSRQAQSVLGREVRTSADESMGRIVDVVVDREGRVRAAVIDFGGFLGVGSRKIAVDWNALHFETNGKRDLVRSELTRDQVNAAPEYKEKEAVVVLGAAGGLQSLPE